MEAELYFAPLRVDISSLCSISFVLSAQKDIEEGQFSYTPRGACKELYKRIGQEIFVLFAVDPLDLSSLHAICEKKKRNAILQCIQRASLPIREASTQSQEADSVPPTLVGRYHTHTQSCETQKINLPEKCNHYFRRWLETVGTHKDGRTVLVSSGRIQVLQRKSL